jgi:hypothetical protein
MAMERGGMSRTTWKPIIASFAAACVALTTVPARAALEYQYFNDEPGATAAGWTGLGNRNVATGNDFGFSNTNNAGGVSGPGEIGGLMPRTNTPFNYYADLAVGNLSLANPLTASGRIVFETQTLDGSIRVGWFNSSNVNLANPAFVGLHILEGNRHRALVDLNDNSAILGPTQTNGVGPTSADFTISWDPTTRVATSTVRGLTSTVTLSEAQFNTGASFNAFGLLNGNDGSSVPTQRAQIFLDDLTYTSAGPTAINPTSPELRINRFSGATRIVGAGGTNSVAIDAYTAASNAANPPLENVWVPASWNSVTDQIGGTWSEVIGSTQSLSEQNAGGSASLAPNASISLGNVWDKATGAQDITFNYSLAGESFTHPGNVVFDGGFGLKVNKQNGNITIINNEALNLNLDGYIIQSASGALAGAWNSLQDKTLAGWEEIASSDANELSEVNLSNSSQLNANGGTLDLGAAYSGGLAGPEDLKFTFSLAGGQLVAPGAVQYVSGLSGDYNSDNKVDAADYTVWRDTLNSTTDLRADGNGNLVIDTGDYQTWKTSFGQQSGSGAEGGPLTAVPEPATWLIAMLGLVVFGLRRSHCIS